MPKVSVVVITYNHVGYVEQTVRSLLAQRTRFPFEIVIGEDCSTDGTREVVRALAAERPDVIRAVMSESNVGAHRNHRRTIEACRGEYLAWCEGDDLWHDPGKLERQAAYLDQHPDCAHVYSDYDEVDTRSGKRTTRIVARTLGSVPESPDIRDILAGKAGILTCTVMARRSDIVQVLEADPHLHGGHFLMGDTPMWAEASLRGKIHFIPESLATRNLLPESATQSASLAKRLRFWASNAEMSWYLCEKHGLPRELADAHRKDWRRKSLRLAFLTGERGISDDVRARGGRFDAKDWVWYLAARHRWARALVRAGIAMTGKELL